MKKLLLIFAMILVIAMTLVSCDKLMNDIVGLDEETTAVVDDITSSEEKISETEPEIESIEEQTSEIITDAVIIKVDLDSIVAGGKVVKKHDPSIQIWSETMQDYRVHIGIDIECEMNAPVYSMIDGIVTKIWEDSLMGTCLAISDGTYTVVYKNLSGIVAKEGENIEIKQRAGYVGDSAMIEIADPPHLHLELFKNDVCIDPLEFIYGGTDVEDDTHPEENTTVSGPEVEISEVDMDTIVKGGNVIKKHDPNLQVYSQTMGDYRVHLGIDIECEMNAPVNSMIDGEVKKIWSDSLMGNCVAISNGTYVVIYKNLASQTANGIEEGSKVTIGQLIGYVGDSALIELADPPHLHLEITKDDISIDPLKYIVE